ncbi:MAG: aldo/keto reductase family protein [Armatimonadetes bacterium]|nr:aldo/keto reductase family protein [Armatimonadota bacterium]MDE2207208.1 aldo/keto reductase family protein [Armatimonadota bacterium]
MEYRRLGSSGLEVSEVCLGSWLTYGAAVETGTAHACMTRAWELGINFFDTANVYARGEAEKSVGAAIRNWPRDQIVVATKVFFPMSDGPLPNNRGLSRKHIFEQCERSLKRLGLDYIDLYQCHRYDTGTPLEETLRALDDLVRQGKVLYTGFSMWSPAQIARAVEMQRSAGLHPFISSQPYYNMLGREIEREVVPVCDAAGIGQIVFSPLAQGVLTGKYRKGQPPPAGSRATDERQNMFFNPGMLSDETLGKVEELGKIAKSLDLSMAQLALAWCLRLSSVSSVIIGASRPEQVEDNAGAAGRKLSADAQEAIENVLTG